MSQTIDTQASTPPSGAQDSRTATRNEEHLRMLAFAHYTLGGMTIGMSAIPLAHVGIGLTMMFSPIYAGRGFDGPFGAGAIMTGVAVASIGLICSAGILTVVAGRNIARRRWWRFNLMVAGFLLVTPPFMTILGILSIVILKRPAVQALFNQPAGMSSEDGADALRAEAPGDAVADNIQTAAAEDPPATTDV